MADMTLYIGDYATALIFGMSRAGSEQGGEGEKWGTLASFNEIKESTC
jgi:hypothetical protein